jgi:hypothetical protein
VVQLPLYPVRLEPLLVVDGAGHGPEAVAGFLLAPAAQLAQSGV